MAARTRDLRLRVLGDSTGAQRALGGLEKRGGKFNRFVNKASKALVGLGVAGLAFSVKKFADFDDAMTKSTSIMGDLSGKQLKGLEKAAREVGKTTVFSATEAAEALFFLASAGLDAEQSMAALPQVARFATAGAFDLQTATDLLTDAQSALGLSVDDATKNLENMARVSDVLSKANNLANTSTQQVAEALTNKLGAGLRAANKDVEEGVAVLAAFADQGLKGQVAGERLNIILRDLPKAALENADAFKELNIRVFDGEGNLRNMADIVADMEKALGPLSDRTSGVRRHFRGCWGGLFLVRRVWGCVPAENV